MLPAVETNDFPLYGPNGEIVSPGSGDFQSTPEEDPIDALKRANEELRQVMNQEREASKFEINQAKRRVDFLEKHVQMAINQIPNSTQDPQNQQFSWDAWNQKPGQTSEQPTQKEEPNVAISPSDFDALYQQKRQQEAESFRELSRKQQQAADEFIRDPRLAPYYFDALVEFQRLDALMPGASFDDKMKALHATVGDWISRGWAPRNPFDPKKMGGGIPVGGQQNGIGPGGIPLVGDNRFRPDEQGVRGQVGFYSDEQRRADAEHDRKARIQDLEARKAHPHGGTDAKTYEEYFRPGSRKE